MAAKRTIWSFAASDSVAKFFVRMRRTSGAMFSSSGRPADSPTSQIMLALAWGFVIVSRLLARRMTVLKWA